jgi:UDP-GlcNAc:undecaprenyl-phosphate GlcNAc-1-phosphate transferase
VIIPGYSFQRFFFNGWEAPFRTEFVYQGLLYLLSFFWVVGVTNAINFIDGVDGLAGGISLLAALTYALIFSALGNTGAAVLFCLCLAAVTLGFLVFNLPLPKARIFMGDGGAYFLGFVLAILPLISAEDGLGLPLPYAAILLSIPIFDTFAAMWRRLRDGRRIDSPDMLHTHHKLINLGLSSRRVDLVLYSLQILIGVLVYFSVKRQGLPSLVLLGTAYALVIGFFTALHFMNRAALRKKQAGAGQG